MSQVDSSSAKKSTELTLIDRLSRLSYQQTLKLLGSDGPKLLRAGDSWDFRIEEDVCLSEDLFRLKFPLAPGETESPPVVTISLMDTSNGRLRWHCTVCESLCEHVGAAFSFILDIQQHSINQPAREILRQLYKQVGSTDCWRLLYDPDSNQFWLRMRS